ncbi:MAG: hypothetical protein IH991_19285 [Planctomycetes bacterium]|nr:hypothetical protein [Planctomycetota bacterium]
MRVEHPRLAWAAGRYWRVQTAHFQITTNHSIKAGLELGNRLEDLHDVWSQLFFRFWGDPAELATRVRLKKFPRFNLAKKHRVVLFRDRKDYVAHLAKGIPGIEVTEGIYIDQRSTSYFYMGDENNVSNWYHEATHQLFHESRPAAKGVGLKDNFWIIEGIAMYLESLSRRQDYWTVGGFCASRLQVARFRALNQRFYVPLKELTTMGRDDVQKDARIRRLYSQSAGLTHFLMDGEGGKYRRATIDWLRFIYAGREDRDSLVKLTGASYKELDGQYKRFLNVTDEQMEKYFHPSEAVTSLLLGHTTITDKSLLRLRKCKNLESLDLAYTKITNDGILQLAAAINLNRLNLEGTGITDDAVETLSRLEKLDDLDLSHTKVTDACLAKIAKLKNLRVLWLTGTQITDEGLQALRNLKKLESLDVSRTNVTTTAYNQLKQSLPLLKD